MNKINKGRYMAEVNEDFVLFIIGMRINKFFSFRKWVPVFKAMGPMIKELYQNPQLGFLHTEFLYSWKKITIIQYWKSFEQLEAYAHGKTHLVAWKNFNNKIGNDGTVGIFHESYRISKDNAEAVYNNMPKSGLAQAYSISPVTKRTNSARNRMNM